MASTAILTGGRSYDPFFFLARVDSTAITSRPA
jgi:hypothetical protein